MRTRMPVGLLSFMCVVGSIAGALVLSSRSGMSGPRLSIQGPMDSSSQDVYASFDPIDRLEQAPELACTTRSIDRNASVAGSDASFSLRYPAFRGSESDQLNGAITEHLRGILGVDARLDAAADGFIAAHAQAMSESDERSSNWSFALEVVAEGEIDEVVCLSVTHRGCTGGEEFTGSRYLLVDALTGQTVGWQDMIIPGQVDEFTRLAETAFRSATGMAADEKLKDAGYHFAGGSFSLSSAEVGFTPEGAIIHFNACTIAAPEHGSVTCVIRNEDLAGIVSTDHTYACLQDASQLR